MNKPPASRVGASPRNKGNGNGKGKVRNPSAGSPTVAACIPLTGGGISKLAHAPISRLIFFQLITALIAGACVALALRQAWFPVVEAAVEQLPREAALQDGRLYWPDSVPRRLAQNSALEIVVQPRTERFSTLGQTSDLQLELRLDHWRLNGILGGLLFLYPPSGLIPLDRQNTSAAWGAWKDIGTLLTAVLLSSSLVITWWALAWVYTIPVWLLGRFFERFFSPIIALKLSAGSLIPGALFASVGFVAYGFDQILLPGLILIQLAHIVVAWLFIIWAIGTHV